MQALFALEEGEHHVLESTVVGECLGDDDAFFAAHAEKIETKLRQAKMLHNELTRAERQREELSRQVSHLEREAVVNADGTCTCTFRATA